MKLVSYRTGDGARAGAVHGEWIVDLQLAHAALLRSRKAEPWQVRTLGLPRSLLGVLERGDTGMETAREALGAVTARIGPDCAYLKRAGLITAFAEASLAAPIERPSKIICLGRNYRAHAEEGGNKPPVAPDLFAKYSNTLVGPTDCIVLPKQSSQVDYEAEMAVVIGTRARHVARRDAYAHVAGYSVFNDVSARDVQLRTSQWGAGKNFDGFAPMGPWLVTRDEIPDPQNLELQLKIGGEILQTSNTSKMIFDVPAIIEFLSHIMTLEPGDIIATGTPEGVGLWRKPQRWLKAGERVLVTIEGIGTLDNPVVDETFGDRL